MVSTPIGAYTFHFGGLIVVQMVEIRANPFFVWIFLRRHTFYSDKRKSAIQKTNESDHDLFMALKESLKVVKQ